ncbi:hypothetical protein [Aciditerrimonas ferrireducens]|uniref:hypothetical protein n=1 Tax=Aciditerrimonas ferrireducens TaxID=667306 RepID=UPI002003605B|nr:hypothetical protein [Aciditerrimonas ferrireducens]MCK4176457.1 hypothetical protein [Aciditerrimonas ferrireducens]
MLASLRRWWQVGPDRWRRRLVVALGLVWILDGLLQFQPSMYSRGGDSFAGTVLQYNTMGRPNPLTDLIHFAVTLTYGTALRQDVFNTLAALVQLAIGLALLRRRSEKLGLAGTCLWALVPWIVGEALGQMPFPQASMAIDGSPGAAVVYILLALALWPRRSPSASAGPDGLASPADGGLLGSRGALGLWSAIWVGTALLELEHANWAPNALAAQLRANADGEPGFLASLDRAVAHLVAGHGLEAALLMALVQVWVGIAALRPLTRTTALKVGVVVSVLYWVVGQNLGGLLTGSATDPQLGPMLVLYALALWPRAAHPVGLPGPTEPVEPVTTTAPLDAPAEPAPPPVPVG